MKELLRIVVTGSECTGKTTLARKLAATFDAPWVPEAARARAESKGTPLTAADVEPIARAHMAAADEAERQGERCLFLDTDLISTVVYARHYYGGCPAWIEREARLRRSDLYLLHHTDIPWTPDPSRDRGDQRREMHALFVSALREFGAIAVDVMGCGEAREAPAFAAVEALLGLSGRSGR